MGNSLVNAAREGNLAKVAKVCGDKKTNINYQESENGVTALMEAAHAGHLHILGYLINKGADINLCSKLGVPAIVYAAARNRLKCVEHLVACGADPGPIAHIRKDIVYDKKGVAAAVMRGFEAREKGEVPGTTAKKEEELAPWEMVDQYQGRTRAVTATPHKHSIFGRSKASQPPVVSAPKPETASPPAAPAQGAQLNDATNMLKGEVEKLKAFLSSSGDTELKALQATNDAMKNDAKKMKSEIEKLTREANAYKQKLNAKEEECSELAEKLGEVVNALQKQELAGGVGGDSSGGITEQGLATKVGEAAAAESLKWSKYHDQERGLWETEKAALIQRQADLEDVVGKLTEALQAAGDSDSEDEGEEEESQEEEAQVNEAVAETPSNKE